MSFSSLPSADGEPTSELSEVHQSPVGSRCINAYLRFRVDAVDTWVAFEGLTSSVSAGGCVSRSALEAMILSTSKDNGEEWKDARSRSERARLQKRSCCAAGGDGRDRGCEEIGNRCWTADCHDVWRISQPDKSRESMTDTYPENTQWVLG